VERVAEIVAIGILSLLWPDGTDFRHSNYWAGDGNCKRRRLRFRILKSFSSFRPSWPRHRLLRPSAFNAERRGHRLLVGAAAKPNDHTSISTSIIPVAWRLGIVRQRVTRHDQIRPYPYYAELCGVRDGDAS
jgi:hypothetical protein